MFPSNSSNYLLIHPNLLLMVNKSKNMEVNEITKPNIINGLDLSFSFLELFLEETKLLFLLERRFEKGLITINMRSKLINLKF